MAATANSGRKTPEANGEKPKPIGATLAEPSFLDAKRAEIKARIDEIKPYVEEHAQLTEALAALNGTTPTIRPTGGKRGRPKGTGTRAQEAIAVITKEPGLTANEIAERMGINQNYLYRVLPALAEDDKIEKRGRGWYLPEA